MQHSQTWQVSGETALSNTIHVTRIIAGEMGSDSSVRADPFVHPHRLLLLRSGEIQMIADGKEWLIVPPVVVNIPWGVKRDFAFSATAEGFMVTLPADLLTLFKPTSEIGYALLRVQSSTPSPATVARFEELATIYAETALFKDIRLRAAALMIACDVLDCFAGKDVERFVGDARIHRFVLLIQNHMVRHLGIKQYAQELCMSPRHLSRLCRKATGLSAQDFVRTELMREACHLLAYTRMSVQQVAYHLGFEDSSYFSRAFRRSTQLSPTAYRNHLRR